MVLHCKVVQGFRHEHRFESSHGGAVRLTGKADLFGPSYSKGRGPLIQQPQNSLYDRSIYMPSDGLPTAAVSALPSAA